MFVGLSYSTGISIDSSELEMEIAVKEHNAYQLLPATFKMSTILFTLSLQFGFHISNVSHYPYAGVPETDHIS
jgi:hypothetical protein